MESLVSVIIPCYNQAQYLPDALNSVLAQTHPHWECIIVNDGSSDNTEEVALEWGDKDSRFLFLNKENGGLSDARNAGIKHSRGTFILPLDSDDKISPTYLEEAVNILKNNSNIRIVYGQAEFFGNKSGKWNLPEFSPEELLFRNIVYCSAVFHKEDFMKTPGYNVDMKNGWEDWDLWLSLLELGCSFYKIPKTHFFYRIRDNSMIRSLTEEKKQAMSKLILLNHIDLYISKLGSPQEAYQISRSLLHSKDYRLGSLFLNPLRRIKRLIK